MPAVLLRALQTSSALNPRWFFTVRERVVSQILYYNPRNHHPRHHPFFATSSHLPRGRHEYKSVGFENIRIRIRNLQTSTNIYMNVRNFCQDTSGHTTANKNSISRVICL
jgi:hypothetical protein